MKNLIFSLSLTLLLVACGSPNSPAPQATLEPQTESWRFLLNAGFPGIDYGREVQIRHTNNPAMSYLIAYVTPEGTEGTIRVMAYNSLSERWVNVGDDIPLRYHCPMCFYFLELVADSRGYPIISFSNGGRSIMRFDGVGWVSIPSEPFRLASFGPELAIDSGNRLYINGQFFREGLGTVVRRWNGTAWTTLGSESGVGPAHANETLIVDRLGRPTVAFKGFAFEGLDDVYVRRWNKTEWADVAPPLDGEHIRSDVALALDSVGRPVVAVCDISDSPCTLKVKRWTGTSWVQLGGSLTINGVAGWQIAVDSHDQPIVSWSEEDGVVTVRGGQSSIFVKRWNGSLEGRGSWVTLGSPIDSERINDARYPSLSVKSSIIKGVTVNTVAVAWEETVASSVRKVYVKTYSY